VALNHERLILSSSRSPLGIIALFIVLVDLIAGGVLGLSSAAMDAFDRHALVLFLVCFPAVVLAVFTWLVVKHHTKLYGPGDFRDDANWLKTNGMKQAKALQQAAANAYGKTGTSVADVETLVAVLASAQDLQRTPATKRQHILWVDDRPQANVWERDAFEQQGTVIEQVQSTEQALAQLDTHNYAAIISDMGRREGEREGLVLLERLRTAGRSTPFFIYTGSDRFRDEALSLGADGYTTDPRSLVLMVNLRIG
jgi:CheY-like chemotaxis protein